MIAARIGVGCRGADLERMVVGGDEAGWTNRRRVDVFEQAILTNRRTWCTHLSIVSENSETISNKLSILRSKGQHQIWLIRMHTQRTSSSNQRTSGLLRENVCTEMISNLHEIESKNPSTGTGAQA